MSPRDSSSSRRVVILSHRARTEQGERAAVSDLLTVRYPSGDTEFRSFEWPPQAGDVLRRQGGSWLVEQVLRGDDGGTVVILRPLIDGTPGQPPERAHAV